MKQEMLQNKYFYQQEQTLFQLQYQSPYFQRQVQSYLPPQDLSKRGMKTLVLDLDETLVHSSIEHTELAEFSFQLESKDQCLRIYVIVRPGVQQFLFTMAQYFEIVIFTAGQKQYAENVIQRLDPGNNLISYILDRSYCIHDQEGYLKDISKLGRNLKDIIIIDNSYECFSLSPENGYLISSFFNDFNDNELFEIIEFLVQMSELDDVRDVEVWKQKFDEMILENSSEQIIESLNEIQETEIDEIIENNNRCYKIEKQKIQSTTEESTLKLLSSNENLKQGDKQITSFFESSRVLDDFHEDKKDNNNEKDQNSPKNFERTKKHQNFQKQINIYRRGKTLQNLGKQKKTSENKQGKWMFETNQFSLKNIENCFQNSVNDFRQNITIQEIKASHFQRHSTKSQLQLKIQEIRFSKDQDNVMSPLTKNQKYLTKNQIVKVN